MKMSLPLFLLALWVCLSGCYSAPPKFIPPTQLLPPQQVQAWSADLDSLPALLEQHHINPYHSISKEAFVAEIATVKAQLPGFNRHQLTVAMMGLMRLIGDGHTSIAWWQHTEFRYPLYFAWFDDSLKLVRTIGEQQDLLGAELVAVEGKPISEVLTLLAPITSIGGENQYASKDAVTWTIHVAEVLFGLGISADLHSSRFTFKVTDGSVIERQIQSVHIDELDKLPRASMPMTDPPGFALTDETDGLQLYINESTGVAFLDFSSYPSEWQMLWFGKNVLDQIEQSGVRNVVIDLRQNGGGNFFVGLILAQFLVLADQLDWQQGIYTLIGHGTFSAGASNAVQFRQLLNATLVGLPTGGNPHGYQDGDRFQLPRTGWSVNYSKRYYRFQAEATPGVQPDIWLAPDWHSYRNRRDNQIQWVLDKIESTASQIGVE